MYGRWLAIALAFMPGSLRAGDGVIELNHAKALAGDASVLPPDEAGYPIEIRSPGSYRLTGDLIVPQGAHGILLMADLVHLDLNGFSVRGSEFCLPGFCQPANSTGGIIHDFGGGGFAVTVRNGVVSNFGGTCIQLRDGGRVEGVRVFSCGGHGIHLRSPGQGDPATAFGNYVSNTGESSLVFEGGGLFRDNVLLRSGLYFSNPTIVGGTATGGNFCDDGRCSRRGTRRYYLSQNKVAGNQALSACAAGYHMAARSELARPELEYDTSLGTTTADAGSGPPAFEIVGWARTGAGSYNSNTLYLGSANCSAWTSGDPNDRGMALGLKPNLLPNDPNLWEVASPWVVYGPYACDFANPVWCIED
jgi:hypothetical protein